MAKYLIVNADDFGMCSSANKAVFDLFETGNLKSATIMMPCPTAKEAVDFAIAHPEYAIGVHTTLTSEWQKYRWKPLTDSPSLVDEEGYMWHEADMVERHAKYAEIEKEVRAQLDLAISMGMKPSHMDNHMGSLYGHQTGRFSLGKLALRIAADYGLPYRLFSKIDRRTLPEGVPWPVYKVIGRMGASWIKKYNVIVPDYLLFPDWGQMDRMMHDEFDYELYKKLILRIWADIPDGVTETFVHPAVASDELRGITGRWMCRDAEYKLLKDPETWRYLEDHGVKMISYRDLVTLKSQG